MTTIGDLYDGLNNLPVDLFDPEDRDAVYHTMDFLELLPNDLDVASAVYYLNKERKQNDTGVDYRVEIHTYDDDGGAYSVDYESLYPDDYEY